MSRIYLILKLLLFMKTFTFTFTTCEGYYTITAPGSIKSNRKYTVCVALHNVTQSGTLRVGIQSNLSWNSVQEVSLQPFETKMLDFFPPKLDFSNEYELFAEGIEGLHIRNSTTISFMGDGGANIYIETDRGAYKPGDIVHFRVIILNEDSKPFDIVEPIKVYIYDGEDNRVKQFKDIRLSKGVYSGKFQIFKEPVLGLWTIEVSIGGKYNLKSILTFEVKKYVLPKFQVYIETDQYFIVEDRILKFEIYGKYTYNKYVEGIVNATVTYKEEGATIILRKPLVDDVEYRTKFEIDLDLLMKGQPKYNGKIISITAWLTENQTGVVESNRADVRLQTQRYKITIPEDEVGIRNGRPYLIKAKVQHWNDTIVTDTQTPVHMHHGPQTYQSKLNNRGVATFEYDSNSSHNYTFYFKDSNSSTFFINIFGGSKNESNGYSCSLTTKHRSPQPNTIIEVLVQFNDHIPYFVYTLVAHGNILKNELVQLHALQNSYTIRFATGNEILPVSFLYVHNILEGNLIYCEMRIEVAEQFENKLSVSVPKDVKPGEEITIEINAQPGSHVSLSAIDSSSNLLRPANTIKKSNVLLNMRLAVSYTGKNFVNHPGISSGLIILTDANYNYKNFSPIFNPFVDHKVWNYLKEGNPTEVAIRSKFPETWIFKDLEVTSDVTTLNLTVPDTITTWMITAFSINEKTGIDILDPSVEIKTFKPFFINTYLPYSIKRGEIISIPIVIFNYHDESLATEVQMDNSLKEFKFLEDGSNKTTNEMIEKRNILVPANSGKSVNFLILPQNLGHIDIRLIAKNKLSTDGIFQKLLVEPNGLAISHNNDLYVSVMPADDVKINLKTNIPTHVASNSEYLQLSISGNVLLPSLENIDDLVDKPTGCGEQNMIHLAPDILVMDYLKVTRQTSKYPDIVAKAKIYIEKGYQQQLKFRHRNGAYSVFGPKTSKTPSTWLTAYVIRFFIKAMKYLPIESKIIETGLTFLSQQQSDNGEFTDGGYLFNPSYQNRYGFTAFVLLSFMESAKYAKQYKKTIQKALDFLSDNCDDINDVYSLAIMATAFQMAKHERAEFVLDKLKPLAKIENDLQWWTDSNNDRVTDIEITAYILCALLHTPGQHLSIVKWLLQQRNSHGGFKSTQDTVVGLQALIKFAELSAPQNDTLIKVSYRALNMQNEEVENDFMGLDPENIMLLQHYELPSSTRSLDITFSGKGNIFLQFYYHYQEEFIANDMRAPVFLAFRADKTFIIRTKAESPSSNSLSFDLEVCFKYQPLDDVKYLKTNMIIAEINLPSGYITSTESIEDLKSGNTIERIDNEIPHKLILYFGYLESHEETCVNIAADKKDDVRNLQPSLIEIYDFYHSDRRERVSYEIINN